MKSAIPKTYFPDLLLRLDIIEIIGSRIKLNEVKQNLSFVGICPFHEEKTPSFTVNKHLKFFHCFGCNYQGNVIDFLMRFHNIPIEEIIENAVIEEIKKLGIKIP